MSIDVSKINQIHSDFQRSLHALDSDLMFWNHFINKWSIPKYQAENPAQVIHASAYSAYDTQIQTGLSRLRLHYSIREIHSDDLPEYSKVLFNWIEGLAIVRIYNAIEILLLQIVDVVYFDSDVKHLTRKKDINHIIKKIETALGANIDKSNNKHLISFLRLKSDEFNFWIDQQINIDISSTWEDYFYLISVLRHVVVHQAMLINKDLLNEIRSKTCYEVFCRYFEVVDLENDSYELQPIQERFNSFINTSVQFAVSTLQFVAKENDVKFLGLR